MIMKNWENDGTGEIGLIASTPDFTYNLLYLTSTSLTYACVYFHLCFLF